MFLRTKIDPNDSNRRFLAVVLGLCAMLLSGCGDDGPVTIVDVAEQPRPRTAVPPGATDAHRLRLATRLPERDLFEFDLPAGWAKALGTPNRNPNFSIAAAPDVQVYATVIVPKGGNTMVGNLARWYRQMSLDPDSVTDETVKALPRKSFVDRPTPVVDLRGTFKGRGSSIENARMIAFVQELPAGFVTFKIVGPDADVGALESDFHALAASFRLKGRASPHGHGAHGGGTSPANGGAKPPAKRRTPVTWTAPDSWNTEPPNQFLLAAFRPKAHPDTRCTISLAGGDMAMNLNRWRNQMGLPPAAQADIEKLPTRKVLGGSAFVVRLDGDFTGAMRQPAMKGARMLGVILVRARESLFVKMLGPKDVIDQEEANFLALCDSLKEGS